MNMQNVLSTLKGLSGGLSSLFGDEDPKKKAKVFKTQAEVNAANRLAKKFAEREGHPMAQDVYVGRKPGDPEPPFIDYKTGGEFVPNMVSGKKMYDLPKGLSIEDVLNVDGQYGYIDPVQGNFVAVDAPTIFSKYGKKPDLVAKTPLKSPSQLIINQ